MRSVCVGNRALEFVATAPIRMDAKNDDSAGSDSLDKSLQKKCVVDDVGQGEGSTANTMLTQGISDRNGKQKSDTKTENRPAISFNSQNKTEKSAGDGISGSPDENNCLIDGKFDKNIHIAEITNDTNTAQVFDVDETVNIANINSDMTEDNTSALSNEKIAISDNTLNDAAEAPSEYSSNSSSNCSSNNSNAFETKVKQISKNLKETTLAECANKKTLADDTNSTSSASSASSASSTPECEQAPVDEATAALYSLGPSTSAAAAAAAAAASVSGGSAQDENDHRSKKVRFHPDVKENDGGNRVISKKKKKLKTNQAGTSTSGNSCGVGGGDDSSGSSQRGTSAEDEMELDEEEDLEEEGTFSIAKTIEDAQDYLKEHPLTFAGSYDKSNVTTQSGLLEEEDLPQLVETSEDYEEEFFVQEFPENGVACILGKQNKCGKVTRIGNLIFEVLIISNFYQVEFLLRYVDRPGLFWETEEFISLRCPNLLHQYEQCRERRQTRLVSCKKQFDYKHFYI